MDRKKVIVRQRFDAASQSYDAVATIQKECAQILVAHLEKKLPGFYPSSILDLGTGTGYVPETLFPHFPKSAYTLNDIAPQMLTHAWKKFGHSIQFESHLGDMETTDFPQHDLIISNFALQWTTDLGSTLERLYQRANVLAFSCLLEETFQGWTNLLQQSGIDTPTNPYPSLSGLEGLLRSLQPKDFSVDARSFSINFARSIFCSFV